MGNNVNKFCSCSDYSTNNDSAQNLYIEKVWFTINNSNRIYQNRITPVKSTSLLITLQEGGKKLPRLPPQTTEIAQS